MSSLSLWGRRKLLEAAKNNLPPWWILQISAASEIFTASETNYKQEKMKRKYFFPPSDLQSPSPIPYWQSKKGKQLAKGRVSCGLQLQNHNMGPRRAGLELWAVNYRHTYILDSTINIFILILSHFYWPTSLFIHQFIVFLMYSRVSWKHQVCTHPPKVVQHTSH